MFFAGHRLKSLCIHSIKALVAPLHNADCWYMTEATSWLLLEKSRRAFRTLPRSVMIHLVRDDNLRRTLRLSKSSHVI